MHISHRVAALLAALVLVLSVVGRVPAEAASPRAGEPRLLAAQQGEVSPARPTKTGKVRPRELKVARGWRAWEHLGGHLTSAPSATAWSAERIDVFALGSERNLWQRTWDAGGWRDWNDLGRIVTGQGVVMAWTPVFVPIPRTVQARESPASAPACVQKASRHWDCFLAGPYGRLWHRWFRGDDWSAWEVAGEAVASAPSVTSWGERRLDLFVRSDRHRLLHRVWDGTWSSWKSLGAIEEGVETEQLSMGIARDMASAPACIAPVPGVLDCLVLDESGRVLHGRFSDGRWGSWRGLPGEGMTSTPSISSWGVNRLDAFVRGSRDQLLHSVWNGSTWSDWNDLGGDLSSAPSCVAAEEGMIDCFAKGRDLAWQVDEVLLHRAYR